MSEILYNIFSFDNVYKDRILEEVTTQHSLYDQLELDDIIMNHFKEGLLYFSEILIKYNSVIPDIINNTHVLTQLNEIKHQAITYIECYLSIYLEKVITRNELQFLINNHPASVLRFHQQLIIANLNTVIITKWLYLLYSGLKDIFRKQFYQAKHSHIITTLFNCHTFRNNMVIYELDETLTAQQLEHDTIIGILVNYMNYDYKLKTLSRIFNRFIYQYDVHGYSFFTKWLLLLQKKNKPRNHGYYVATSVSSDAFMLNTLRFVLYIWNKIPRDSINSDHIDKLNNIADIDNETSFLILGVTQQITLTILPVLTKYHYYINKLEDLNDIAYDHTFYNNLNIYRDNIQQKISHYELLIKNNNSLTCNSILQF